MKKYICIEDVRAFEKYLFVCEKSSVTISKYIHDCKKFLDYIADKSLTKEMVISYKQYLVECGYAVASINSMLAAVNSFVSFINRDDCRVKFLKSQRKTYASQDRQLFKSDYMRLLKACGKNRQLYMILQTIGSTGIRVSELKYITVEAVKKGEAAVNCKNKNRIILIPKKLQLLLKEYIKERKIKTGSVFVTRTGKNVDRSFIWRMMKKICGIAGVASEKVFPHNLRKLFARTFYTQEKDIAKLADVLGHSNIETTRIYIMTSFTEHRKKMDRLGLIM